MAHSLQMQFPHLLEFKAIKVKMSVVLCKKKMRQKRADKNKEKCFEMNNKMQLQDDILYDEHLNFEPLKKTERKLLTYKAKLT